MQSVYCAFRALLRISIVALLLGGFVVSGLFSPRTASAAPGINQQVNFQGRLLNAQGAAVADGYYNIQFKIYQDGTGTVANNPTGTLEWTEDWTNQGGNGVQVKNGYMSVQLGSVNPFGSQVDWNQDTLWLSINIGNTNVSCTPITSCALDGEMLPMKRLGSTPYAMNAGMLGGLTSAGFIQNQNSSAQTTANFWVDGSGRANTFTASTAITTPALRPLSDSTSALQVQNAAGTNTVLTVDTVNSRIGIGAAVPGSALDVVGDINTSTDYKVAGVTTLTNGALTFSAASTANISSAASQSLNLNGQTSLSLQTAGVTRATFDNANSIYLGNGVTAAAPSDFAIRGTGSSTSGVAGGALSVQGGNATVGNANGGNVTISGGSGVGSGVNGLVILTTPTFSTTANDANCYTGGTVVAATCTMTANSVNSSSAVIVGFSTTGQTANMPDPTTLTAGRVVYVTAANGSSEFSLVVNGGGQGNTIAMRQNTTATMIWNGADWTAAGASSSTTLQSAYDNTLQSAGGAELVVSKTSTTNGLTIRDSSTDPVNGTLLSVQTSSAAGLLSVNGNVAEYSTNSGAEVAGASASTFPANTWSLISGATVSRYTTAGNYIATGKGSVSVATNTTAGSGVRNRLNTTLVPNMTYNVSFGTRLSSGNFNDLQVYYSINGSAASVPCTTTKSPVTSIWSKINCTFVAPASGITADNSMFIRQANAGTARTFYVDNLSVTIAADFNYATDGSVNDGDNFATNWSFVNATSGVGSITRSTTDGEDASDSAQVTLSTGAANAGIRNRLSVNPLPSTLYRMTAYAKVTSGTFNDFKIRYSPDGSTGAAGNYVDCVDYNTRVLTTTTWTKVTCFIETSGTAATNPHVYFVEESSAARTFRVDAFTMTLTTNTASNVQIGGGENGGPTTLLTLDKSASAPIAINNDALLGSMYYDTTLGKLQCYEADGWGACGSSPDTIVTISPEFTNAVLHGTGIGTMVSDLCSDTLNINDGSSGQPNVCGTNETFNFYRWTSPQPSAQTYGLYVTYQLPASFKSFESGATSIIGRTDSVNSTMEYQVYRDDSSSGLTPCGPAVLVSSGVVTSWQPGAATGTADPSTCGFVPGNSIVFRINVTASQNANAYIGNLNFKFSNK